MEIKIKKNDYVKPTEIREDVVQKLCDFYTSALNTCWNEFCPNACWRRHYAIGVNRWGSLEVIGNCTQSKDDYTDVKKIRTCEMREFFKVWLGAGYYISKGSYSVRGKTAILYKFTEKPYINNGYHLVSEFTEDID